MVNQAAQPNGSRDNVRLIASATRCPRTLLSSQDRRKALVPALCIPPRGHEGCSDSSRYSKRRTAPSSPSTSTIAPSSPLYSPTVATTEDIGQWELVPYDVPWGSEYYHYEEGTLPGPEGKCFFLRSPTPLEKRRAPQACRMCRERKAKCSGTHPTCQRCLSRGLICEYAPESRRKTKAVPHQRPRPNRALLHPYSRRHSDAYSATSSTESSDYASSNASFSPKHEEQDFSLSDTLSYPSNQASQSPHSGYWTPDSSAHSPPAVFPETEPYFAEEPQSAPPINVSFWPVSDEQPSNCAPPAPAFHAPRPLRYSQSMPFLSSTDHGFVSAGVTAHSSPTAEPPMMVMDPRMTSEQPTVYYMEQPAPAEVQTLDSQTSYAEYVDTNALMLQYTNAYTNASGYTDGSSVVYLACPDYIFAPPEAYVANQVSSAPRDSIAYQHLSSTSSLA